MAARKTATADKAKTTKTATTKKTPPVPPMPLATVPSVDFEALAAPMSFTWKPDTKKVHQKPFTDHNGNTIYHAALECSAYIDARQARERLNTVVGHENWCSDYKTVGTRIFCGIGLRINDQWVYRWDTAGDTGIEPEKGQASDSFKRAAAAWGIGEFLYKLPRLLLFCAIDKGNNRPIGLYDGNKEVVFFHEKETISQIVDGVYQQHCKQSGITALVATAAGPVSQNLNTVFGLQTFNEQRQLIHDYLTGAKNEDGQPESKETVIARIMLKYEAITAEAFNAIINYSMEPQVQENA